MCQNQFNMWGKACTQSHMLLSSVNMACNCFKQLDRTFLNEKWTNEIKKKNVIKEHQYDDISNIKHVYS